MHIFEERWVEQYVTEHVCLNLRRPVDVCICSVLLTKPTLYELKQQFLTLTATHGYKTAILVKSGHILQRKCPLVSPLMSYDCSICPKQQPAAAAAASVCRQPTCCFQEPP